MQTSFSPHLASPTRSPKEGPPLAACTVRTRAHFRRGPALAEPRLRPTAAVFPRETSHPAPARRARRRRGKRSRASGWAETVPRVGRRGSRPVLHRPDPPRSAPPLPARLNYPASGRQVADSDAAPMRAAEASQERPGTLAPDPASPEGTRTGEGGVLLSRPPSGAAGGGGSRCHRSPARPQLLLGPAPGGAQHGQRTAQASSPIAGGRAAGLGTLGVGRPAPAAGRPPRASSAAPRSGAGGRGVSAPYVTRGWGPRRRTDPTRRSERTRCRGCEDPARPAPGEYRRFTKFLKGDLDFWHSLARFGPPPPPFNAFLSLRPPRPGPGPFPAFLSRRLDPSPSRPQPGFLSADRALSDVPD